MSDAEAKVSEGRRVYADDLSVLEKLPREATFTVQSAVSQPLVSGDGMDSSLTLTRWKVELDGALPASEPVSDSPGDSEGTVASDSSQTALSDSSRGSMLDAAVIEIEPGPKEEAPPQATYSLRRLIGRGGCGEVWEAVQESLGRVIAVKRLRDDIYQSTRDSTVESKRHSISFKQEALTTGSLEHPNIVPVYDLGLDEFGRPLLAMKLVRGKPWDRMVREDFPEMSPPDFLAKHLPILMDVAQAVAFAHSRGYAHRDVKPSQVMVGEFGEVLLMDWGLAVVFDTKAGRDEGSPLIAPKYAPSIYAASSPSGTPAFMAPEQTLTTASQIGAWTDIFLLGGTLYLLLTGTPPYNGKTAKEAFAQARTGEIEPPESRAPGREIAPELSQLALHAMEKNPRDRVPTVKDFISALQDYLSGASKRRESMMLSDQVVALLENAKGDYKQLAACDNLLVRALGLWPENPAVAEMRERVLADYARAAVGNGDLVLARVQADRLEGEEIRREIQHEIRAAEKRAERTAAQRRHAMFAIGILILILGFVGLVVHESMKRADQEAAGREADQQQVEMAQTRALEHKFMSEWLAKADQLRAEEAALAADAAKYLPVPSQLFPAVQGEETAMLEVEDKGIGLVMKADRLRRKRADIRDEFDKSLAPVFRGKKEEMDLARADFERALDAPPPEVILAEANFTLYKATNEDGARKAYETYRAIREQHPNIPQAFIGMGVAAARAGDKDKAQTFLEEATQSMLQRYGPLHPFYLNARAIQEEAKKKLGG